MDRRELDGDVGRSEMPRSVDWRPEAVPTDFGGLVDHNVGFFDLN